MRIFGFYISRTDWKTLYKTAYRPRDENGRFLSKQKQLQDQMRSYYNKQIDYTALKEASKIEEFGR